MENSSARVHIGPNGIDDRCEPVEGRAVRSWKRLHVGHLDKTDRDLLG